MATRVTPSNVGPLVGDPVACAKCGSWLVAGDLVRDVPVFKAGTLHAIEIEHDTCPVLPLGYHAGPNHLHGLAGRRVYASSWGQGGRLTLPPNTEAWQRSSGLVDLVALTFEPLAGGGRAWRATVIERSLTFQQLDAWVDSHGVPPCR